MKPLEFVYLVVGIGIIVHGSLDHGLTVTELGAGMFFIGLVPVSKADRADLDSPAGVLRRLLLTWLNRDEAK